MVWMEDHFSSACAAKILAKEVEDLECQDCRKCWWKKWSLIQTMEEFVSYMIGANISFVSAYFFNHYRRFCISTWMVTSLVIGPLCTDKFLFWHFHENGHITSDRTASHERDHFSSPLSCMDLCSYHVRMLFLHILRPAVWAESKECFFYSKICLVQKLGNLEHVLCSVPWVMTTYLRCITQNRIVKRIFGCNVFLSTYYNFYATGKWNHDIYLFPPCTYAVSI